MEAPFDFLIIMFIIYFFFLSTGDENSSQPSKSNQSATQAPPQISRKRTLAEVDDQMQKSLPMYIQAAPWQCCERMFRKRTLVESYSLRWPDVSLRRDPATGNERLFLKVGSSRGCQEEGEHPLQPAAVKLCKICSKKLGPGRQKGLIFHFT